MARRHGLAPRFPGPAAVKRLPRLDLLDDDAGPPLAGWTLLALALPLLGLVLADRMLPADRSDPDPAHLLERAPPAAAPAPSWVTLFDVVEAHDHAAAGGLQLLAAQSVSTPPGLRLQALATDPQALREGLQALERDPRLTGVELLQQAWQEEIDGRPAQLRVEIQARWHDARR